MSDLFQFKRSEEELESIVKCYIFPSLIAPDPDQMCWSNLEYAARYQKVRESGQSREFLVFKEDRPFGCLVLKYLNFENQNAMVNSRIFDNPENPPSQEETVQFISEMSNFIFQRFDVIKIYGCLDEDNPYLPRVQECGFHIEGRLSRQFFKNGRFMDQLIVAAFSPRKTNHA